MIFLLLIDEPSFAKQFEIDTPLKASIFYFPSPSIMRCLNHSNIPNKFRKAIITKRIKIPRQIVIEQRFTIGVTKGKADYQFAISGNQKEGKDIFLIKVKTGQFFNQKKENEFKLSNLFGLEDLIGLQKKVHVKDKLGNQDLNYVVFLKTTQGKIGGSLYKLELYGQDKNIKGVVKYFLDGSGSIGNKKIFVSGEEIKKDYYEINEQYGLAQVITYIKVYD